MKQLECPHCATKFGVFSKEWQRQKRHGDKRFCPSCGREVFVKFRAGRFLAALACVGLAGIALTHFIGAAGYVVSFFAACTLPLLISPYLDREG
jgi:hypothetical protein